jgi:hypothetical protein
VVEAAAVEDGNTRLIHSTRLRNKTVNTRYPESKLLEVLLVRELVTQMSSTEPIVIVNMIDPGLCESELGRNGDGV